MPADPQIVKASEDIAKVTAKYAVLAYGAAAVIAIVFWFIDDQ